MSEDWDLFAVVRSCSSFATSNTQENNNKTDEAEKPPSCLVDFKVDDEAEDRFLIPSFGQPRGNIDSSCNELQDSYKPFLQTSSPVSVSKLSDFAPKRELKEEQVEKTVGVRASLSSPTTASLPVFVFRGQREEQQQQVPVRSRKRKNQQKRTICHVTQENLSSDMWAWRKYGQKPIKGSPYPRNYYRCSSSKGCLARKQVERSNLDPKMFIVTYTGEHTHPRPTHRNSLAGSTRNKQQSGNPNPKPDPGQPPNETDVSSTKSDHNLSPTTPLKENDDAQETKGDEGIGQEIVMGGEEEDEEEEEDDDGLLIPNLGMSDPEDFFGLAGDFPSWAAGGSASAGEASATAGGGG